MRSDGVKRICLWSGPRNVSTALMYAFSRRADTTCLDEPLYGHYLFTSGADHPAAEEVMRAMPCDGERIVRQQVLGTVGTDVLFCKMMAHHLVELDLGFLQQVSNVILTRNPREVLATLVRQIPNPTLADTGYETQVELLQQFGPTLPVLDAKQLLLNPQRVLSKLCDRLGIAFDPAMLSWPAGPKPFDGVWAPHWYHNVHQSTGFAPYRPSPKIMPLRLQPLLARCQPLYDRLQSQAITAEP